jgi:hypothetical protein
VTVDYPTAVPMTVKRGDLFSRTAISDLRQAITDSDKRIYMVYPETNTDGDARRVDLHFKMDWRWPWDAQRYWLSHLR